MATNTSRLDLLKVDTVEDASETFNIDTMLNDNWDKIDEKVAKFNEEGKVVNKDGTIAGGVTSVNGKKGDVNLAKDDIGLDKVDNVKQATKAEFNSHNEDSIKHITAGERSNWNGKETTAGSQAKVDAHANKKDNPHGVTKTQIGLDKVDNIKQATKTEFDTHNTDNTRHITSAERIKWNANESSNDVQEKIDAHANKKDNPHEVTKLHIGLDKVDNIKQATKTEFNSHNSDSIRHVTAVEKSDWDAKETTAGSQAKATKAFDDAITHANKLKGNHIIDNRSDIPKPSDYENNRTTNEFKFSASVNLGGIAGTYVHVFTERAWSHTSGGYVRQLAYDGLTTKMWTRFGNQTTDVWGSWDELETTAGSQSKVDAHADRKDNPHDTTKEHIGLASVENYEMATLAEAKAGNVENKYMNPKLTKESAMETLNKTLLKNHSILMGFNSKIVHGNGIAIGSEARAGIFSTSTGRRGAGIAIGAGTVAEDYSTALGDSSSAENKLATAIGYRAIADGNHSAALGANAYTANDNEGVLGTRNGTLHWEVPGDFTVNGTKNFEMPHPHPDKKDTHRLRHSAVESPTAGDNLYRYTVEAEGDNVTVEMKLPDFFQYLNKDVDVWVNGHLHFGRAFAVVEGDMLKVTCETAGQYKVLVIGTRNDEHQSVKDWDIKGVERENGESWSGETYSFEVDEIMEVDEIREVI